MRELTKREKIVTFQILRQWDKGADPYDLPYPHNEIFKGLDLITEAIQEIESSK